MPKGEALAHMAGDYLVQTNWMAQEKTSRWAPAVAHAAAYTACFLPVTRSVRALAIIGGTHLLIDRYRLAKYVVWAKEQISGERYPVTATGYPEDMPPWMSTWLMIIADNTMHLLINRWALSKEEAGK